MMQSSGKQTATRRLRPLVRCRTMTHIAIEEKLDGQSADWLEKVSEKNIKVE